MQQTGPGRATPAAGDSSARRLFFALWPDDALRDSIARAVPAWLPDAGGRRQRRDQWHATLVFVGRVAAGRHALVVDAASVVRANTFTLRFDRLEHWRKPRVVCLVASRMPDAARGLVDALRHELAARGIDFDRREFRAHVTLARKVARLERTGAIEPLEWPATRFALVESSSSSDGSQYAPLAHFELAG
jgi:2'-5' RNA ligase